MKNLTIAICLVVFGGVLGVAYAAPRGPLWTYHNGNTLQAQTAEYRQGFMIGVVDGYLQGHRARAETGDDGLWLERCLTAGWTLKRADRELAQRFETSVPLYPNPAAAIVLDNLKDACGAR